MVTDYLQYLLALQSIQFVEPAAVHKLHKESQLLQVPPARYFLGAHEVHVLAFPEQVKQDVEQV